MFLFQFKKHEFSYNRFSGLKLQLQVVSLTPGS